MATSWTLRLESSDVANAPQTVLLRYADAAATQAGAPNFVSVNAPDPSFAGIGVLDMTTPTGMVVHVPVRARALNGALVLFDDTQQLSPSGKLVLQPGVTSGEKLLEALPNSDAALFGQSVRLLVSDQLSNVTLLQETTTGALSGTFSRTIFGTFRDSAFDLPTDGTFHLAPSALTSGLCSSNDDCALQGQCDLGFCSFGPPHDNTAVENSTGNGNFTTLNGWGWDPFGMQTGDAGFNFIYAPDPFAPISSVLLNGPISAISGEPLATVYAPSGSVIAANLPQLAIPLLSQHDGPFPQPQPLTPRTPFVRKSPA